jgi:MoaA/NifB/PqqE/SkfB family radical SAM enzyme
MKKTAILPAWGRILTGRRPLLSLEITKECPLHCPGCYAYQPEHLGGEVALRQLADFRGDALVNGVLGLVRRLRPIHISIVGGEPLVRYRELDVLLPKLDAMGIEVQLVTSAVRPIPSHWAQLGCLHLVVSIDGLQPDHDVRRTPATYDRILKHIEDHRFIVHCTITRQFATRPGYLEEFARLWSAHPGAYKIWFSLFTPQEGEVCAERLTPEDRAVVIEELARLRDLFPKIYLPQVVLDGYIQPPAAPEDCIFAQVTECVSADLKTPISPCQFGGRPVCSECGCIASAGMASIGRYELAGLVPVLKVFKLSQKLGERVAGAA